MKTTKIDEPVIPSPFTDEKFSFNVRAFTRDGEMEEYEGITQFKVLYTEASKPTSFFQVPDARDIIMKLSPTSLKLMFWIMSTIEEGKDFVKINKQMFLKEAEIKGNTWANAVKELKKYWFIAETGRMNMFWVNPRLIYRGNRLTKFDKKHRAIVGDQYHVPAKFNFSWHGSATPLNDELK